MKILYNKFFILFVLILSVFVYSISVENRSDTIFDEIVEIAYNDLYSNPDIYNLNDPNDANVVYEVGNAIKSKQVQIPICIIADLVGLAISSYIFYVLTKMEERKKYDGSYELTTFDETFSIIFPSLYFNALKYLSLYIIWTYSVESDFINIFLDLICTFGIYVVYIFFRNRYERPSNYVKYLSIVHLAIFFAINYL